MKLISSNALAFGSLKKLISWEVEKRQIQQGSNLGRKVDSHKKSKLSERACHKQKYFFGFANKWTQVFLVHRMINKTFFKRKFWWKNDFYSYKGSTKRFLGEVGWARNG